jgi:hypothetical protein
MVLIILLLSLIVIGTIGLMVKLYRDKEDRLAIERLQSIRSKHASLSNAERDIHRQREEQRLQEDKTPVVATYPIIVAGEPMSSFEPQFQAEPDPFPSAKIGFGNGSFGSKGFGGGKRGFM